MITGRQRPVNGERIEALRGILAGVLAELLQDGCYGSGSIEIDVVDGVILTARHRVERVERFAAAGRPEAR